MKAKVPDSVVSKVGLPKTLTGVWGETERVSTDRSLFSTRKSEAGEPGRSGEASVLSGFPQNQNLRQRFQCKYFMWKPWWGWGVTRGGKAALLGVSPGRYHCGQLQLSPQGALETSLELVLQLPRQRAGHGS